MAATELDQVVNLCKRRGFVYPSAEIYGGFRSSYDYGPLGSLMLRNVREAWIRTMVQERDDVVLIDAAILAPPQVFEASGHLANFSDPLVDCTKCKQRFREDHLLEGAGLQGHGGSDRGLGMAVQGDPPAADRIDQAAAVVEFQQGPLAPHRPQRRLGAGHLGGGVPQVGMPVRRGGHSAGSRQEQDTLGMMKRSRADLPP